MVDVSSQNNSVSINVSSSGNSASIKATPDTAQYYSEKSREYAISDKLIDGKDYSSKYYAQESKQASQLANTYKEATEQTYISFSEQAASAETELTSIKDASVQEINTAVADGKTEITTAKDLAIDAVNNTKTTILQDIEFVADGEKEEIRDIIDTGKEELKESIDGIKVLTTLEIGDIGFTQMAIDETKGKRRILNGQLIIQDQYVQFTNIVKESVTLNPSLACTEAEWQTAVTMSTNGVCEKFVIDDEAGTIRLPKYPTYIDLTNNASAKTATVSIKGNGMTLGLTNAGGNFGIDKFLNNSSLLANPNAYGVPMGSSVTDAGVQSKTTFGLTTDASKSGITGSVTVPAVTSEKIKGTYFIQVATGAETEDNIVNEIELNNPFSLLDYKYSEYELNNVSWLRSNGQWNSKAVYPAVYDLLLKIYNGTETKAGVSVKLLTDGYTDYDFVLNTAEETFRLPVKVKQKFLNAINGNMPVVGNGMTLGLTNGTQTFSLKGEYAASSAYPYDTRAYGQTLPTADYGNGSQLNSLGVGVTTDATKSGLIAKVSQSEVSGLYLYFYVGETVQNANLINAGRIEEKVASLIPDNSSVIAGYAMPSNKYTTLTIGASDTQYTAPANGWFTCTTLMSANGIASLDNMTTRIYNQLYAPANVAVQMFTPVKKGDKCRFSYSKTMTGSSNSLMFIYAEGEQ